jgi:hypothetical protein
MAMTKKVTMEAMMECMNALVPAQGEKRKPQEDKENTPPLTNAGKDNDKDNKPRGIRRK